MDVTCEWIVKFRTDAIALGPRAAVDEAMLAEFRWCYFRRKDFASGARRRFLPLRLVRVGDFLPFALFVIPAVVAAAVGRFVLLLLLLLLPSVSFDLFRLWLLLRFAVAFATLDLTALLLPPVVGAVACWMATGWRQCGVHRLHFTSGR